MHEMALCEGLLQVLEEQASEQAYRRVRAVWLEVGALAGVDVRALRFAFDVVCRGTLAEGAALHIDQRPAPAWCMQCARQITVNTLLDPCPDCGGGQVQVLGGDQMRITELEVD